MTGNQFKILAIEAHSSPIKTSKRTGSGNPLCPVKIVFKCSKTDITFVPTLITLTKNHSFCLLRDYSCINEEEGLTKGIAAVLEKECPELLTHCDGMDDYSLQEVSRLQRQKEELELYLKTNTTSTTNIDSLNENLHDIFNHSGILRDSLRIQWLPSDDIIGQSLNVYFTFKSCPTAVIHFNAAVVNKKGSCFLDFADSAFQLSASTKDNDDFNDSIYIDDTFGWGIVFSFGTNPAITFKWGIVLNNTLLCESVYSLEFNEIGKAKAMEFSFPEEIIMVSFSGGTPTKSIPRTGKVHRKKRSRNL
ncbi:unnamed protein product [Lepeophtheirus salmonis]|uniref:(salmon louse) hypothetical protein n=1 Tax=Lepeophtheirus salmonis TaxID=72036 RepID=A0A7R8CZS3_LEPSM|nr:unnamed protein product [Lepeophtheirus salmonis]CAF2952850.1 unnamed protein product [Lepeophtheirus salmonis]